jgi:hypothetical protein
MSKIDDIFKNKLSHKSESHPEHLWKAIEQELDSESKRPMAWVYVLTALLLFSGLSTYMLLNNKSLDGLIPVDEKSKVSLAKKQTTNDASYQQALKYTQNQTALDLNTSTTYTNEKEEPTTDYNSKINQKYQEENLQKYNKTSFENASRSKTTSVNQFNSSSEVSNAQTSPMRNSSTEATLTARKKGDSDNNAATTLKSSRENSEIKWKIETTDKVKVSTISAPEIIKRKAFNRRREIFRSPMEIENRNTMEAFLTESYRKTELDALAGLLYMDCPTFSKDRTGMYLDLYVNHELPFVNMSSGNNASLLALREDSESRTYSNSFGGRISLSLPSGLSLRTGFNWTQINSEVSFADERGTQLKSSNTHQLVEIPFLLGYEFGNEGSRVYYAANAGVLLNVRYTQEGSILNDEMVLVPVNEVNGGSSAYEDTAGASMFASFGIYYRWLKQFDLYVEPNIRINPGRLTQETYDINERYTSVGIMTGLRYRF